MAPRTQYAPYGDLNLAYQVVGEGDVNVVLVPGFISHVEVFWAHPAIKSFLDRIASFSRLLIFDKAGTGLSDPVPGVPTLEERAGEIEAVMDAAGMERAAVFGFSEGGPMAILFSVTRPERVESLILSGTYPVMFVGARPSSLGEAAESVDIDTMRRGAAGLGLREDEFPEEPQLERARRFFRGFDEWGEGKVLKELIPNGGSYAQLGRLERLCASPGMARATMTSALRLDVTDLLEAVDAPTLIVHAKDDLVPVQGARLMARRIRGARLLEVDGVDHAPWFNDPDEILGEIEQLLTGERHAPRPDRVLATVLFTDIVGSTERAAELGDARWRSVIERHDELTRERVSEFGGAAVKRHGRRLPRHVRGARRRNPLRRGRARGARRRGDPDPRRPAYRGDRADRRDWRLLSVAPEGSQAGEEEWQLAQIEIGSARSTQRPTDRLAAAVARRFPGALRAGVRLDPRNRRSVKEGGSS